LWVVSRQVEKKSKYVIIVKPEHAALNRLKGVGVSLELECLQLWHSLELKHLDDCRLSQVGRVLLWRIVKSYMYKYVCQGKERIGGIEAWY
jgi:predicted DNA-binding protein (UPF0251 family)